MSHKTVKYVLILFIFSHISLSQTAMAKSDKCIVTRAAFDIGSGASKMRVIKVNKCTHQIIKKIEGKFCDYNEKVAYKEDLKKNGQLTYDIIKKGIRVLKAMMIHAKRCGASEFAGSATSAFRQAKNGQEAVERLSQSGVKIKVISQQEEANLGYIGAISKVKADKSQACVWDIGGSSMQITCPKKLSYLGHLASVPFKHEVLKVQKSLKSSPNPITARDYRKARRVAIKEARKIRKKLQPLVLKKMKFIGIGGVHYYAVAKAIGKDVLSLTDLEKEIQKRLNKTDEDFGSGKYVDTYVSNIILVKSIMEKLKFKDITVANINLTEGLSISENYWN